MSVFTSQLQLNASTSGNLQIQASATTTSYTLTMPAADGSSGQVLTTNGAGLLSWTAGGGGGSTGVASFSAGTTGLTPATATTGDIILAGTLAIGSGGTGAGVRNLAINNLLPTQVGVPDGFILVTDGQEVAWAQNTGGLIPSNQERFDAPGTFEVPAGVTEVTISMSGGGGGGGCGGASNGQGGSGGGSGGQAYDEPITVTPGELITVTIGTAGGGGSFTNGPNGDGSSPGGGSSFGTYMTVNGGAAGSGGHADGNTGFGGAGGTPLGTPGTPGSPGVGGPGGFGGSGVLAGTASGGNGQRSPFQVYGNGSPGVKGKLIVKWGGTD